MSTDFDLAFRPVGNDDLPQLQRWLREPHVDQWWHGRQDLPCVRAKSEPRIDGSERSHVFVMELTAVPIGWIQWARWADYPQHAEQLCAALDSASVDLAIGVVQLKDEPFTRQVMRRDRTR